MKRLGSFLSLLIIISLAACGNGEEIAPDEQEALDQVINDIDALSIEPGTTLPTEVDGFDVTYNDDDDIVSESGEIDYGYYDASMEPVITVMLGDIEETLSLTLSEPEPLSISRTVDFRNRADEYLLDDTSVDIRYNVEHTVPYISLSDAIDLLDGGEKDGAIDADSMDIDQNGDVWTLTVETENEPEAEDEEPVGEDRTFTLEFDASANEAHVNKFDFFNAFSESTQTDFGQDLEVKDFSVEYADGATFAFDDYNLNLFNHDDELYIPFQIANKFLSGQMYDMHYISDEIIGYDGYSYERSQSAIRNSSRSDETMHPLRQQYTYDYMTFVFDHFYGLKDDQGVDTYYDVFEEDDFFEDGNRHYINIFEQIYALDDMHTSMSVNGMYTESDLPQLSLNILGDRARTFQNNLTAVDQQGLCANAVSSRTLDDESTAIINIPGFDENTGDEFGEALETLDDSVEDIVVDLSCNTGGVMGGMIQVLGYMTDEPVELYSLNAGDGATSNTTYTSDVDARDDINWHVRTSGVTYSAGNIMAQVVSDMDLGTLIGEQSAGGAASIQTVALPNGAIIVISSPSLSANANYESIEFGVPVDEEIPLSDFSDDEILKEAIQ